MIVRSLSLSKEKARIIEDAFNMTSTKQKDVERYFGQNYYVPPDHQFEDTQKIDIERTVNNGEERINSQSVINPRRPMSKQIEMWNQIYDSKQKKLKIITDDYYHESISVTTSNYLENIRQVVIDCQEKIRKKRKQLVNDTTAAIRKQWEDIRTNLMAVVNGWCKRSEQEELAIFLEKGAVFSSGPLSELATRLTNKREQIELHFSRVVDLYKNKQILKGEDLTKHMLQVKSYLKEIWDQNYQFEVQELQLNVNAFVEETQSLPYQFEEGACMRDILHRSIDDSLAQFSVFQPFFENFCRRQQYKATTARKSEGSVRKNIGSSSSRDVIIESFVYETMKELEEIRAQRDREWKYLTQKK